MGDFSKTVKVMQYCSVLTSEFGFYHYHGRGMGLPSMLDGVIGGEKLNKEQAEVMRLKWKKLGSAFSTARMTLRFADCIGEFKFFFKKFRDIYHGRLNWKEQSALEWVMEFIDFVGGVTDNWVFLERIKLVKYTRKWQEDWVDWMSSATCILSIFLNMFVKLRKIYNSAN